MTSIDPKPGLLPTCFSVADAAAEFRAHVLADDFPCVGAKAALRREQMQIVAAHSIRSAWDDLAILDALMQTVAAWRADARLFRTLGVLFMDDEPIETEAEFERHLWDRLQSLSDKDAWLDRSADPRVSHEPESPHFSLSFGGEAFFVVGLHPAASRPARRTPHPALVFNLHAQFEQLRADGRYEPLRETILARDLELAGSANPMLARHGSISEARQYSGRSVKDDWTCPFAPPQRSELEQA